MQSRYHWVNIKVSARLCSFLESLGETSSCLLQLLEATHCGGKWKPTSVLLSGKSHGQRNLVGYSLRGCKESDMTEWWSTQKPRRGLGLWPLPPSSKPVMAVWVLVILILTLLHPSSMCDGRSVWWKDHWPTWTAQDPLLSSSQLVKNLNSICSLHSPLPRTYQIYRFLGLRQGLVWRLWL